MRTIGDTLRNLRESRNMSQEEVAEIIGVDWTTYAKYEINKNKPSRKLKELAELFGVSVDYLLCLDEKETMNRFQERRERRTILEQQELLDNNPSLTRADTYNIKKVPVIGEIACGKPILANQNITGYAYTTDTSADFVLIAKGDSMVGKRIFEGDLVFLHQQEDVEDGEIAAVLIDGEATLKIVHHVENTVVLSPANEKYKPMVFRKGEVESFRILGRVVKVQIDFK